ncbi:MAG: Gfo/Idh/MocA family oxidoreductase [Bacteroidaceae bacterium]|jgi:predicted dehydrogenase|nr:Gfo/Idh/MocA family oxidoreductase [Bacteroidaceae bacterium]
MSQLCRVVIIGAGERTCKAILPALRSAKDEIEIVALCDRNKDKANRAAQTFNIKKIYTGDSYVYRQMIEKMTPDAVVCIGQPDNLYDAWVWILEKGYPLMIEKPLGLTMHQAEMLRYLALKKGVVTQVAFQRRVSPMVENMRKLCLESGSITHAVSRFYKYSPTPYLGARGHVFDDTVHSIDTLRWICGGEVVSIQSHVRRVGVPDINFVTATLIFDNGSVGVLINSWLSGKREFSIEMHAPGIFAQAEHEEKGYIYKDGSLSPLVFDPCEEAGSNAAWDYTGVTALCRSFAQAVKNGTTASSPFEDAYKTMQVAFNVLAQDQLRRSCI